MRTYLIKCSRDLSSQVKKAWRIERPDCCDLHRDKMYDIVWQANGEAEEIFIMVDKKDLKQLYTLIGKELI